MILYPTREYLFGHYLDPISFSINIKVKIKKEVPKKGRISITECIIDDIKTSTNKIYRE